jgi:acetyl-CoA/propionyl-CoA carboxylase biotin carboxyl carrier protein
MASGDAILPNYDSLIAKLVVWDRDRPRATARMRRALQELEIAGVPTTREFHLRALERPEWIDSAITTTFLDRHPGVLPPPAPDALALEARDVESTNLVAEVDGHRFEVRVHGSLGLAPSHAPSPRRPAPPPRPERHRATADGAVLRSPIQGTVVRVNLAPGDAVQRGQTVCVVEAMKMENDVTAHRDGVLGEVVAVPGMAVRVGDALAEIV